ncbi:MAG: DUF2764 family protein [Rikenellaceae bacterium]
MGNYHYIVSSLVDYSIENDAKDFDAESLCEYLKDELTKRDFSKLKELWWFCDLRNILEVRKGKRGIYGALSNLTEQQVEQIIKYYSSSESDESDLAELPQLPENIEKILLAFKDEAYATEFEINTNLPIENTIWSAYYQMVLNSNNRFIREWSLFDLNIRNISAAYAIRELGGDVKKVVISDNDIVELIIQNETVPDFSLKNEFSQIDELMQILSESDILLKERNLDKLRIKIIDELITFDYFNLEAVLAYMVKISLLTRWSNLKPQYGKEVLEGITKQLTSKQIIDSAR